MKTKRLLFGLLVFAFGYSYGQSENTFTLEQCIEYALKNSNSAKNAELDEYIAQAQKLEYLGIGLPQINGSASVMDNPRLQRMFMEYGGPGSQGFASSIFAYDTAGIVPAGIYGLPNFFQLRSNGDAKLSASQIIFNGSYLVGLQASKTLIELSKKNTVLNNVQIVENVTKAYYSVLITKERKVSVDANIANLDSTLRTMKALNQQGFIEKIDVDRMEVTYNNVMAEKAKLDIFLALMVDVLKFQMGYDVNSNIDITGDFSSIKTEAAALNMDTSSYQNRPEYSLLKVQLKLENHNLKNKRMYYLPSLVAFGNLGMNRGASSLGGLFEKRGPEVLFPDPASDGKLRNISGTWFNYFNYGLSLNVPIFSGFTQHAKAQQSKLAIQKIENNIEAFKQATIFQTSQSATTLKSNIITLENQKRNLDLATEIKRVAKIKYEQGIGSNLEVVNAETSYKDAVTNYYNAMYDVLIATIDYKKATGTLSK